MPDTPSLCQPIERELAHLNGELQELRAEQAGLDPRLDQNYKRRLAATIGQKISQIFIKRRQLQDCILANGGYVCIPTDSVFACRYVLVTDYVTPPPDSEPIGSFSDTTSINILFPCPRTSVFIRNFPPITTKDYPVGLVENNTTVSMISTGRGLYDSNTGSISIPVSLFFDQRIDLPFIDEDSIVDLTFTTGLVQSPISGNLTGMPMDRNGNIRLVGTGTFRRGWLNGSNCDIILIGSVLPVPQ